MAKLYNRDPNLYLSRCFFGMSLASSLSAFQLRVWLFEVAFINQLLGNLQQPRLGTLSSFWRLDYCFQLQGSSISTVNFFTSAWVIALEMVYLYMFCRGLLNEQLMIQ